MKKKMLSCIMAVMTMFTCINISSVKASETTEHEHTWVETSETIHHDAEYATKTTWFYNMQWYDYYPDGTVPDGPNKYHINYGKSPYGKFEDMYDFTCYYAGGSLENLPGEYIYE